MSSSTVQESCSDAIASVCVHVWVPMGVCVRAWVCFDPHFPDRCHFQLILLFMVNEPIMHIAAAADQFASRPTSVDTPGFHR